MVVRAAVTGPDSKFMMSAHRSAMPQINMIPNPVTSNWHWANQPCSKS